jgi:hypothetical protein
MKKKYTKEDWFVAASTCDKWCRDYKKEFTEGMLYELLNLPNNPYYLILDQAKGIFPSKTFSLKNLEDKEYVGIQLACEKAGL